VILNLESAARDASAFTEPDTFLLDRPGLTRSRLPFGWGTHFCLGAALSRAAMTVAIEALTRELSDVAFAAPPELSPARGMLRGPESLTVSFRRRGC
jgi:cytochrome P450